ncbi:MAG: DUF790 family protein [Deltaproteobacteria bacterium]|nr:DUF790 family protein [Deltaproteobacteria bacterium]
MLTVDLARPLVRKGELTVRRLTPKLRERLLEHALVILDVTKGCVGLSYGEWKAAMDDIRGDARDKWMLDGLKKLAQDHCSFDERALFDAGAVREALFLAASKERASGFDRAELLERVWREEFAAEHSLDAFEAGLFSDLKDAHIMQKFGEIDDSELVKLWHRGQAQAIMLRADRVEVDVAPSSPKAMRTLLQFMKFHRLLFEASPVVVKTGEDARWKLVIEGPMSMFQSTSKYGLRLALLLNALEMTGEAKLKAQVRWGKERKECTFSWESKGLEDALVLDEREEIVKILREFKEPQAGWQAKVAAKILPGVNQVVVPDIRFVHDDDAKSDVWLELLGFWSREAVIRRVDWAEANPKQHVIFAYSEKLRVSERMLDAKPSSRLLPFKGVLRKSSILDALQSSVGNPT